MLLLDCPAKKERDGNLLTMFLTTKRVEAEVDWAFVVWAHCRDLSRTKQGVKGGQSHHALKKQQNILRVTGRA